MSMEMEQLLAVSVIKFVSATEIAAVVATLAGLLASVVLYCREVRRTRIDSAPSEVAFDLVHQPEEIVHGRQIAIVAMVIALMCCVTGSSFAQIGDMNCDSAVNAADVRLFIDALLARESFGGCDIQRADTNGDGMIDGRDLQAFVSMLLQPTCGAPLILCGGSCVDTSYDNGNCGGCSIFCAGDETCVGGICEPSQPSPECGSR